MGIDFQVAEFFAPVRILRLKRLFDRTQWMPPDERREVQSRLLRETVRNAYRCVPFWRDRFDRERVRPDDIRSAADLPKLPLLDRETVQNAGARLLARGRRPCTTISTSGTTGPPLTLYHDRRANALEFVYYWRWFGWAGYRLGDRYAHVCIEPFLHGAAGDAEVPFRWQPLLRRLLVNAAAIGPATAAGMVAAFRRRRLRFIKGTFVGLYSLARALDAAGITDLSFQAAFSTAGRLPPAWRALIERTCNCAVLDGYGHMERCVAVSQCLEGGYHVHDDYGVLEITDAKSSGRCRDIEERVPRPVLPGRAYDGGTRPGKTGRGTPPRGERPAGPGARPPITGRILGTALHNRVMPLLRYDTGDLVAPLTKKGVGSRFLSSPAVSCPCGRTLPLVQGVVGRHEDVVITPDGRVVSGLFVVHHHVRGIEFAQFVQDEPDHLVVRICPGAAYDDASRRALDAVLVRLTSPSLRIDVEETDFDHLERTSAGKIPEVVSRIGAMESTQM